MLICYGNKVFDPVINGYNGDPGTLETVINMGTGYLPHKKEQLPHVSGRLEKLQFHMFEYFRVLKNLESGGDKYLNSSFLVKKDNDES